MFENHMCLASWHADFDQMLTHAFPSTNGAGRRGEGRVNKKCSREIRSEARTMARRDVLSSVSAETPQEPASGLFRHLF
jgi:hypothetical protein